MGEWTGKRVLVMGLGTKNGGCTSARYAVENGASVTVTDLQPAAALQDSLKQLEDLPIRYRLGGHEEQDFLSSDLVIRNAGIRPEHPLLQIAEKHGAAVESPLTLFVWKTQKPLIGITGTKGKSLTTALAAHLCSEAGTPAIAAGNNCVNPLVCLAQQELQPILELSSWQLRDLGRVGISPDIACWLNFFPDHKNYYTTMEEYFRDKKQILLHQNSSSLALLPDTDPRLQEQNTKGGRILFSVGDSIADGWCWRNDIPVRMVHGFEIDTAEIPQQLQVPHWRRAIAAALSVAETVCGTTAVGHGLVSFPGLPHRFQHLPSPEGFFIINDSAASTPDSALLALSAVQEDPLVLIAGGGGHKDLDFSRFASAAVEKAVQIILFDGDPASGRLLEQRAVRKFGNVKIASKMGEAVEIGFDTLRQTGRGTLLLSPGCSGAPFFRDMFDRGEQFIKAVGGQQ